MGLFLIWTFTSVGNKTENKDKKEKNLPEVMDKHDSVFSDLHSVFVQSW